MKLSKKTLVTAFTVASLAGASVFTATALARSDPGMTNSLASKIATQFHLDQNEVKAAIETYKNEQRAQFEAKFNEQLDTAVASGELTTEQQSKILTKRDELKTKRAEIRNISDDTQRHDAMKQLHADLKQWASDNNIPLRWLGGAGIHAMHQKPDSQN